MGVVEESFGLPDDPVLREAAVTLEGTGNVGWIFDPDWNLVHASDELRLLWADASGGDRATFPTGVHLFSTTMVRASESWQFGLTAIEFWRGFLRAIGGVVLADTPGGSEQLRELVDPDLRDLVDDLTPEPATVSWIPFVGAGVGEARSAPMTITRLRDTRGHLCGSVIVGKPAAGMSTLIGMAHARDVPHLERMEQLTRAGRRSAAILFATETTTSESAAARACIEAARSLRDAVAQVALDTDLDAEAVTLRFGLHWGAALYIGRITTLARTEVTALGDEVNEGARIEACATGGRTLASKNLVERLEADDAAALGLDPDDIVYTPLAELPTATDKARRDAPAIAVCEV
jgi:hypothetical protein